MSCSVLHAHGSTCQRPNCRESNYMHLWIIHDHIIGSKSMTGARVWMIIKEEILEGLEGLSGWCSSVCILHGHGATPSMAIQSRLMPAARASPLPATPSGQHRPPWASVPLSHCCSLLDSCLSYWLSCLRLSAARAATTGGSKCSDLGQREGVATERVSYCEVMVCR